MAGFHRAGWAAPPVFVGEDALVPVCGELIMRSIVSVRHRLASVRVGHQLLTCEPFSRSCMMHTDREKL